MRRLICFGLVRTSALPSVWMEFIPLSLTCLGQLLPMYVQITMKLCS